MKIKAALLLSTVALFGGQVASADAIQVYPNCGYDYLGEGCAPQEQPAPTPPVEEKSASTSEEKPAAVTPQKEQRGGISENKQQQPQTSSAIESGLGVYEGVCNEVISVTSTADIKVPQQEPACRTEVRNGPVPPEQATVVKRYEKTVEDWGPYKEKSGKDLLAIMRNLIRNYPAPTQEIANAPANCCYGMLVRPPVYKEVVVEYIKHDPTYKIETTKPVWKKEIKTIKVKVKDAYYEKVCEKPEYEPKKYTIQITPPGFELVKKNGIICKVKTPGKTVEVTRYVLAQPPKCKTIYHPAVYAEIKVPVEKLVKEASCNCEYGKPEIGTVSAKTLVEGPKVVWDAVLCDINLKPKEIKLIQQKLKELGYYNGPINGELDDNTMAAVVKFQVDHNLLAGNISIQTLEALGLKQLAQSYTVCELRK